MWPSAGHICRTHTYTCTCPFFVLVVVDTQSVPLLVLVLVLLAVCWLPSLPIRLLQRCAHDSAVLALVYTCLYVYTSCICTFTRDRTGTNTHTHRLVLLVVSLWPSVGHISLHDSTTSTTFACRFPPSHFSLSSTICRGKLHIYEKGMP